MLICFACGQFTGASVSRVIGSLPRTIALSGVVILIGFVAASFTNSLPWLYISLGAICGYPIGVGLNNTLALCLRWFPDKAGLVAGIVVMGFGLSSLLLGQVANFIIEAFGWQWAFRMLALAAFVLIVVLSFLLKIPKEGYKPEGWVPKAQAETKDWGLNRRETMKQRQFWMFWFWFLVNHLGGFMIISLIAPYGIANGMAPAVAALLMGFFSVSNAIGRPLVGFLSDRFGRRIFMVLCTIVMACGMVLIAYLPTMMDPFFGTLIGACLVGISFGGSIPIASATMLSYFGPRHLGARIGMPAFADAPAGLTGPIIAAAVFDATGTYFNAFLIAAGCAAVSLIFLAFIGKPNPKLAEKYGYEPSTDEK